ncbi:hypothetical protein CYME_CMK145C [Cyanidioschyzon merolae strain 10D]|uniref:Uncharacterized protein n=1 Tax=Cyanidioschyzon merolae (strain NIES-3377 / 10D) TaxID=280699 RepID=M1VCX9_CYAM1|nr:hypothetical protein CYME_CMK145C [Cyanidioschyzon merolae strain 10D]BAM80522.1 hypothetical protein CYME_CMK145C [Cyanidioschyzon merolae strain 10D]|eukprot:XP_005536558.1 hypothetical protein CYME_CMK145C [Cyanidioschyzon merolae strain 10D]
MNTVPIPVVPVRITVTMVNARVRVHLQSGRDGKFSSLRGHERYRLGHEGCQSGSRRRYSGNAVDCRPQDSVSRVRFSESILVHELVVDADEPPMEVPLHGGTCGRFRGPDDTSSG